MSSLPPYNPRPGDRVVWLLAAEGPPELPADLPDAPAFERVVAAGENLREALGALCAGAEVEVIADAAGVPPADGALLVVGPQAYVEAVLRALMGMPPGTARFVVLPGQAAAVQLTDGRALLTRLNPGRGLG